MNQSNKRASAYRQPSRQPGPRPSSANNARGNERRPVQRPAQHPVQKSAGSAAAVGGRIPRGLAGLIVIGVIAVALGLFLQMLWPNGFPVSTREENGAAETVKISEIHSNGPVRINEIMASNSVTLSLQDGTTPDWIEIANVSGKKVNLEGYSLSKSTNSASVFVFPNYTLEAGESILVYADSRLRDNASDDLHAPFRIGASGDTLMLFNAADTAVDTVNIPAMGRDQSYARTASDQWTLSSQPTPWMENTEESYRRLHQKAENSPVIINELMASNSSVQVNGAGNVYDYIELYNRSNEAVNLSGWFLSDDQAKTRKWSMPEVTLGAGEYLVIYASGMDEKVDPAMLHTSFALSSEGECAVLSNNHGQVMDAVAYDVMKSDQALSLMNDGSWSTSAAPTPGRANQ